MSKAANAAAAYAAMRAAAGIGDFWLQTGHQAAHKADAGWGGRLVVARHAASYAATQAVALVAANALLGMKLKPSRIAAAVAISGITHAVIDRRWPVRLLADATGKRGFHDMGGPLGGAFHLDQSAHHLFEAVAAVVAARVEKSFQVKFRSRSPTDGVVAQLQLPRLVCMVVATTTE